MCAGVTEGQVLESRLSYSLCRVNYSSGGKEDTLLRSFVYNREGVGEADSPSPFLDSVLAPCFQGQGPATDAISEDSVFV